MSDGIKEVNGACIYCGQFKTILRTEDWWLDATVRSGGKHEDEIANMEATMECSCKEGMAWRDFQRIQEEAQKSIEQILDECPEVQKIFLQNIEPVWQKKIKSITVVVEKNAVAGMKRTTNGIEIRFTQKKEKKSEASL